MKSLLNKPGVLLVSLFVLVILCLLSSCEVYHFETPQPIDIPNEVEFPKGFRGEWIFVKANQGSLIIRKNSLRMSGYDSVVVVNKIAGLSDSVNSYRYLKYIHRNNTTGQLDTLVNYIVRGNKIYKKEDGKLFAGAPFARRNDSLYFKIETVLEFALDSKAMLRKINDRRYVLNIREEYFAGMTKGPFYPWWQVILLELSANNKLCIRDVTDKMENDRSLIYSNDGDFYFDAAWTKTDLIKRIDQGYFKINPDSLHRVGKP